MCAYLRDSIYTYRPADRASGLTELSNVLSRAVSRVVFFDVTWKRKLQDGARARRACTRVWRDARAGNTAGAPDRRIHLHIREKRNTPGMYGREKGRDEKERGTTTGSTCRRLC